jgi:hypothetical protein
MSHWCCGGSEIRERDILGMSGALVNNFERLVILKWARGENHSRTRGQEQMLLFSHAEIKMYSKAKTIIM